MTPLADDLRSVLAGLVAKWRANADRASSESARKSLIPEAVCELRAEAITFRACAKRLEAALLHGGGGEAVACVISLGADDWNPYELLDLARLHVTSPDAGDQLLLDRIKECLLQQKRCQSTPPPASQSAPSAGSGELLPCPFCGKTDLDHWPNESLDASGANVIRCAWCHGAAPAKTWNRRLATAGQGVEDTKENNNEH